jgi:EAL domain-containing protein (putative c-di-GMP-specific phosphodiesterase class I)
MSGLGAIELAAGAHLFRAGDAGDVAYVVEDGEIEIWVGDETAPTRVALIGPSGLVGEMAILDGAPRSANARAHTASRLLPISRTTLEERLQNADPMLKLVTTIVLSRIRRMLQAENSATNRETQSDAIHHLKLESQLAAAIRSSGLQLHYQPIVSLKTGDIHGFEALARWPMPDGRFCSPGEFIPVAESSGLVTELTRWAIGQAAADLHLFTGAASAAQSLFMSVNASGRDLGVRDFEVDVIETWRLAGHAPQSLKIEVTESMMMRNPDQARDVLQRLRDAGFRISIDDFGTGHSSLAYLSQLPVNTLKIDRSFVTDIDGSDVKMRMIRAILGIATALGLETIA